MNNLKELSEAALLASSVVLAGCSSVGASTVPITDRSVSQAAAQPRDDGQLKRLERQLRERDARI